MIAKFLCLALLTAASSLSAQSLPSLTAKSGAFPEANASQMGALYHMHATAWCFATKHQEQAIAIVRSANAEQFQQIVESIVSAPSQCLRDVNRGGVMQLKVSPKLLKGAVAEALYIDAMNNSKPVAGAVSGAADVTAPELSGPEKCPDMADKKAYFVVCSARPVVIQLIASDPASEAEANTFEVLSETTAQCTDRGFVSSSSAARRAILALALYDEAAKTMKTGS